MKPKIAVASGVRVCVIALLGIYCVQPVLPQDGGPTFSQEEIDAANALLTSSNAAFLSGSGLNALKRVAGHLGVSGSIARGAPGASLPFASSRFEIMVNDPTRDTLTFFDIS